MPTFQVYWTRAIGVFTMKWSQMFTTTMVPTDVTPSQTSTAMSVQAEPDEDLGTDTQTLDSELEANISRLELLNHQFMTRRFLPATGDSLLDQLIAQANRR